MREVAELESELKERQENFIRRERVYRMRLEELKEELNGLRKEKTEWMKVDPNICNLREMHGEIVKHVGMVQDRTVRLVQEQERDMLTAFRARLLDVQNELEKEKEKKDDGAAAWIERSRQLELEVDKEKERADKLDRINQTLGGENGRLKLQFETQEDDRAFLLRQLVAVKADNAKMRETIKAKQQELAEKRTDPDHPSNAPDGAGAAQPGGVLSGDGPNVASTSSLPAVGAPTPSAGGGGTSRPSSRGTSGAGRPQGRMDADGTYRDMIRKLTKMLDMERKHIAQVRDRAAKGCEILNFEGSYLSQFPLVSAHFWTSDHLSSSSRTVNAFSDRIDR